MKMCPYMAAYLIMITLIIGISLAISLQYIYFKKNENKKSEKYTNNVEVLPQYLSHKGKCFDCEDQMIATHGVDGAWMGQSTKLFSTERDGVQQSGGDISGGFLGKTMKYY